jgi:hypothetical protein
MPTGSSWVEFEGFDSLYVRVGVKYIQHKRHDRVVDIANVTALVPGKGAFRNLIAHLQEKWPEYTIHVENAHTDRFRKGLKGMGFQETEVPICFWLPKD